ncbi:hypothetical protein ABZY57_31460 [Streptomyces sp. NPDC006450]|uniref:hypothetical protein n=1 Tax=Streptomyces sp. NPDC006450 TaxID=3155458 RepID=UPI0033A2BEAA
MSEPWGLPEWFDRNLDARSDTSGTRGMSEVVDSHDVPVVYVDQLGALQWGPAGAEVLAGIFDGEQSRLVTTHRPDESFYLAQRRVR